jgi:hypothetical protein
MRITAPGAVSCRRRSMVHRRLWGCQSSMCAVHMTGWKPSLIAAVATRALIMP